MDIAGHLRTPEDVRAAMEIERALKEKKIEIQLTFWDRLQESLCRKLRLNRSDFLEWFSYNSDKVRNYYEGSRENKEYGIGLLVDEESSLMLGLEVYNNIFFGFSMTSGDERIMPGDDEDTERVVRAVHNIIEDPRDSGVLIAWKYPGTQLNFSVFNEAAINLADEEFMAERIEDLTNDFVHLKEGFEEERRELGGNGH